MEFISKGAQYEVHDIGGGRVTKRLLTPDESREVVAGWYPPGEAPESELLIEYGRHAAEACELIKHLLGMYPEIAYSFGNPRFDGTTDYTQDKAETIGRALKISSESEGQSIIDSYIELVLLHWRYGISERVFNCTSNNGIDGHGRIILLDFGEITSHKDEAAKRIASKRWLRSNAYRRAIPDPLKDYFAHSMESRLTVEKLESTWATRLA